MVERSPHIYTSHVQSSKIPKEKTAEDSMRLKLLALDTESAVEPITKAPVNPANPLDGNRFTQKKSDTKSEVMRQAVYLVNIQIKSA